MNASDWIALGSAIVAVGSLGIAAGSLIVSVFALRDSKKTFQSQRLLSQRQFLLPLWTYMTGVNKLNVEQPVTPEVLKAVHTLELVALCCEGEMVDAAIIRRTFADVYRQAYRQVEKIGALPGLDGRTGTDVLDENPAAKRLFQDLEKEHQERGALVKAAK